MKPEMYDLKANAHIMGAPQLGKSKWVEGCCRDHADVENGFAVLDYHGTLDRNLRNYFAYIPPKNPIVLLDPSGCDYIRPFNPFALPTGADVSAHASRLTDTVATIWGEANTNETPQFEDMMKLVFTFGAITGEPLHHASQLLYYGKPDLRDKARSLINDPEMIETLDQLQAIRAADWERRVGSTRRRLGRLVSSKGVRLFTGLKAKNTTVEEWIAQKAIVLVNLKPSDNLSPKAARTFAALILAEFLHVARNNSDKERPYFLYLDECQNYLTSDAANILDQVLKSGLRVSLIHHHLEQDAFLENPGLKPSVETSAKIKVIFGGLPVNEAKRYAEELRFGTVNQRKEKERLYRLETSYEEEGYEIFNSSSGTSVGENDKRETSGTSKSSGTRFAPRQEKVTAQILEWSREERVSFLAAELMNLPNRHCWIKLPGQEAFEQEVEWTEEYLLNPEEILEYEKALHAESIPKNEAELSIEKEEHRFAKRAHDYEDRGTRRPKKRPASLHPQE